MAATSASYRLPDEPRFRFPPAPDRDLVQICAACHSLDYIQTQPRGKGAQFWRDSVAKMVTVYKAPIDPDQAEKISAYLGRVYGQ